MDNILLANSTQMLKSDLPISSFTPLIIPNKMAILAKKCNPPRLLAGFLNVGKLVTPFDCPDQGCVIVKKPINK